MMKKYPFYFKVTVILFGFVLLVFMLATLREILVPLSFALLLAILLNPVTQLLEKWHFPKVLSIAITIIFALVIITGIAYFLFMEIKGFSNDLSTFKQKFVTLFAKFQHFARTDFGINTKQQNEYIDQAEAGLKPVLASAMGSVLGGFAMAFLLPIYTFLFLYYKNLILKFLYEIFDDAEEKDIREVLTKTKGAIQNYMLGLLLEALIVATLNTIALLLIGVPYAVLLGVLGALLNILPFIGGILAVLLPILIATITIDGFQAQFWVIISYMFIQFIDNHFLVPYIVASKVRINALVSIVIVLLGGALWGISGMFLSIPFIGVMKIIFDRLPEMKPWGMLLGMEIPTKRSKFLYSKRG
ncbi:MAG TPA: AI-2E family transporter [Puia sp.]|jgi:predicted PurR-regulated permease PerM|nr:AI-2E family transporter [Puia sp.]